MSDDLSEEEVDALSKAMGDSPGEVEDEAAEPEQKKPATQTATAVDNAQREPATAEAGANVLNAGAGISQAQFMQLEEVLQSANVPPQDLQRMYDLKVDVEVTLGKAKMSLEKILQLQQGSVVELDKLAGEPVEIFANGKLVARAEVVVIEENFGIKILEIVGTKQKLGVMNG